MLKNFIDNIKEKEYIINLTMFIFPYLISMVLFTFLKNSIIGLSLMLIYFPLALVIILNKTKNSKYLFLDVFITVVFQNVLIGIGLSIFGNQQTGNDVKWLLSFKDLNLYILLIYLLLQIISKKKFFMIKSQEIAFIIFIGIYLLCSLYFTKGTLQASLYYFRAFTIFPVMFFLGRFMNILGFKLRKLNEIFSSVSNISLVAAVVGIVFFLIPADSKIWQELFSLGDLLVARGNAYNVVAYWRTPIFGSYIRRIFSFVFDPISLSYILVTGIIFQILEIKLFEKKDKKFNFIKLTILLISIVLTFGKGSWMLLAAVYLISYLLYFGKRFRKQVYFLIIFVTICMFYIIFNQKHTSSIGVHLRGFIFPLRNSLNNIFGNGLGTGGIYAWMMGDRIPGAYTATGGESFYGTMIYQMGSLFFVVYMLFIKYICKNLGKNKTYLSALLESFIYSITVIAMIQEPVLGLNYVGLLTILSGYLIYGEGKNDKKRVVVSSSTGGHFEQAKNIVNRLSSEENFSIIFLTENKYSVNLNEQNTVIQLKQQNRQSRKLPLVLIYNFILSCFILIRYNPEVVISTGAGATIPLLIMSYLSKTKIIFIESYAKTKTPTVTGKLAYKIADYFYVQWESMLEIYPDAIYKGGLYE